jgi:hypothetical protein
MGAWQPIATAPLDAEIDIWLAEEHSEGWRYTGKIINGRVPYVLETWDDGLFHPAENGCWPTHWRTPAKDDWRPADLSQDPHPPLKQGE